MNYAFGKVSSFPSQAILQTASLTGSKLIPSWARLSRKNDLSVELCQSWANGMSKWCECRYDTSWRLYLVDRDVSGLKSSVSIVASNSRSCSQTLRILKCSSSTFLETQYNIECCTYMMRLMISPGSIVDTNRIFLALVPCLSTSYATLKKQVRMVAFNPNAESNRRSYRLATDRSSDSDGMLNPQARGDLELQLNYA